jgi:hypothetical protein
MSKNFWLEMKVRTHDFRPCKPFKFILLPYVSYLLVHEIYQSVLQESRIHLCIDMMEPDGTTAA